MGGGDTKHIVWGGCCSPFRGRGNRSEQRGPPRPLHGSHTRPAPPCPAPRSITNQARAELPLAPEAYCLRRLLAYGLYPPLYIAGPTLTFNAFASQLAAPPSASDAAPRGAARYFARGLLAWAAMEALTHTLWFFSVTKHGLWRALAAARGGGGGALSPLEMVLAPWWMVILVWCKFLVIWRFFR